MTSAGILAVSLIVLGVSAGSVGGRSVPGAVSDRSRIEAVLVLRQRRSGDVHVAMHHGLTAGEIGRAFGPSLGSLRAAISWLRRSGINVQTSYPQRTQLDIEATAGAFGRVFGTHLVTRSDSFGSRYVAAASTIRIPRQLRDAVRFVGGLGPRFIGVPLDIPSRVGLRPVDVAKAYNSEPLLQAGFDGRGVTIAVLSWASYNPADLSRFSEMENLPPASVERRSVDGGTNETGGLGGLEDSLDLDAVHGTSPGARIVNYEVGEPSTKSWAAQLADGINAVVQDGRAKILSISYGLCDVPSVFSSRDRAAVEQALQAAVRAGITVFVASGDSGAYECQKDVRPADHQLSASFPGDSPFVVSVGGTLLSVRRNGTYLSEAGWQDPISAGGGGGGLNPVDPRPAWQEAPGVNNASSDGRREFPDVSAAADPESGLLIVHDGVVEAVGGTSASTPMWAGFAADMEDYVRSTGRAWPGFLAPALYAAARSDYDSSYHDVLEGGNRHYAATPGWDYATGLGSPDVAALAQVIARSKS